MVAGEQELQLFGSSRGDFESRLIRNNTHRDVVPAGRVHETAVSNSRLQSTDVPEAAHVTPEHVADVIEV